MKKVNGGMIIQDPDMHQLNAADLHAVTENAPTAKQVDDLLFAWKIVKHVKSNAIVFVKDRQVVGVRGGTDETE